MLVKGAAGVVEVKICQYVDDIAGFLADSYKNMLPVIWL